LSTNFSQTVGVALTTLGFNNWKNTYMALPKHDEKFITSVGQHMEISTIKE
jgi:hypothetical protein